MADRISKQLFRSIMEKASCLESSSSILVIQNRAPVATRLLFTTVVMPQAILLFLSAAVGFTLGVLLALHLGAKIRKNQ
jgi:hypothetical protein